MTSTDYVSIGEGDPARGGSWDNSGVVSRFGGATEAFAITAATANTAVQAAHDALPAGGGKITIYGGSVLTFASPVVISKPDVVIDFQGATVRPSAASSRAFTINESGFRAENANVVFSSLSAADHSFFFFDEGATAGLCNGGSINNCYFFLAATTNAQRIHAMRLIGASGTNTNYGMKVTNCTFVAPTGATQQATAFDGSSVPYGFTPIRLLNSSNSHIEGNSFYGEAGDSSTDKFGACVFLDSCLMTTISHNTFADFTCHAADATKGSPIYIVNNSNEGHHNVINNNCFELTLGEFVVKIVMTVDGGFQTICGNNFGRAGTNSGAIGINGGNSVVIAGNNFHNCAAVAPIVASNGAKAIMVAANTFDLLEPDQQPYVEQGESVVDFDSNSNRLTRQIL